jgi:hypothetical protein
MPLKVPYNHTNPQDEIIAKPKPPTVAQWHKAGMTAPSEEYLTPADRAKPTTPTGKSTIVPTAPTYSAPKTSGGIIPTTTNSQPTTAGIVPTTTEVGGVTEPAPAPVEQGPSIQDLINQMNESIRQSRYAALDKARDAALSNLTEQEAGIKPRYYDARNQAAAQSDVGALNFAQYMAGRGIKGNAGGMPEIYRNSALQGRIGTLSQQEQAAYDTIARDRTGVQNAYESDRVAATADIDAQGLQAYINQMNADRAFGLQEGGLTGAYKGAPTLEAQNMQFNQGVAEAGLTGQYQGAPTMAYQQMQADNDYRNRTFDENVRQFNANYGLDLKKISLQGANQAIDAAYKRGQLSLAQARQALDESQFIEQQKMNNFEIDQANLKANTVDPAAGTIAGTFSPSNIYSDANSMKLDGKTDIYGDFSRTNTDTQVIDYVMKSGMSDADIAATLSRLGYTNSDIDAYERAMAPAYTGNFQSLNR